MKTKARRVTPMINTEEPPYPAVHDFCTTTDE